MTRHVPTILALLLLIALARPAYSQSNKPAAPTKAASAEDAFVIASTRMCAQGFPPFEQVSQIAKLGQWKNVEKIPGVGVCTPKRIPQKGARIESVAYVAADFGFPVSFMFAAISIEEAKITSCVAELVDGDVDKAIGMFLSAIKVEPRFTNRMPAHVERAWPITIREKSHRMALLDLRPSGQNRLVMSVCDDQSYFQPPR